MKPSRVRPTVAALLPEYDRVEIPPFGVYRPMMNSWPWLIRIFCHAPSATRFVAAIDALRQHRRFLNRITQVRQHTSAKQFSPARPRFRHNVLA